MKCKLMSLLVVLGLTGCKAETGSVMYVVNSPVPDSECVYQDSGKIVRYDAVFDPTAASSMSAVFRVHNSLNAKDTDVRSDDNGVNVRPDGNHIQLEKVRICYYSSEDVAAAQDHICDDSVPECVAPTVADTQTTLPCRQVSATHGMIPAEDSSGVDEGQLVNVDMLDSAALGALFSGADSTGVFSIFDASTIATARDLINEGDNPAPIDDVNQFTNCRAPGVAVESPTLDSVCVGATSAQIAELVSGASVGHEGEIVRGFGARAYSEGELWGPVNNTFGPVGGSVSAATVLVKLQFVGKTVTGADVSSNPYIFPVSVEPGLSVETAMSEFGGDCSLARVMCKEQTHCLYEDAAGNPLKGECVDGAVASARYKDGCLLGPNSVFTGNTDIQKYACKFGTSGRQPMVAACNPDQLLGDATDYTCEEVNTCDDIDVQEVPDACGDGFIGDSEDCDDGNIVSGDGCDAECNVE